MNCLVWNCRGLGGPRTLRTLGDLIRANNAQIIFLSETKLSTRNFELVTKKLGLQGIAVGARGASGGLGLLWTRDITVVLQSFSQNHIDVHVYDDAANNEWRFTGFYGDPNEMERHKSWSLLRKLATLSNKPWLCAGDFNAILASLEKNGGRPASFREIHEFSTCLYESELMDLGFSGFPFTWTNNRKSPDTIRERIDRACANDEWKNKFPNYRVIHLDALNSDHLPIRIDLNHSSRGVSSWRRRGFKFEAMWLKTPDCAKVVEENWMSNTPLNEQYDHWNKLEQCKQGLMCWSKQYFGGVVKRIDRLKEKIYMLKKEILTEDTSQQIKGLSSELDALLDKEEMMWRQRAKAHWIKEGDKNTKFFHAKASSRKRKNTILGLRDSTGEWCEDDVGLESIVTEYFRNIFTSSNPSEKVLDEVIQSIEPRITTVMNDELNRDFTAMEVKVALDGMHPLKSPGPDGFPALFFQRFWNTVGRDVTQWVLRLLNHNEFPPSCNSTHIVLIPKCTNPERMAQFRPISLSNVVYKIASKAITNRLKPFMNVIISDSQSAFVPSRLISDNILVAYEVAHYMKRSPADHMAIKLDMSKAYDRVEWLFLKKVMLRLGFDTRLVELIMKCVTTVTYSFILNGKVFGSLSPKRGIRQGDPMSPYLFLFCTEALSALFRREENNGNLRGLAVCRGAPKVSHLLFADDTMIFCRANEPSAMCVKNILQIYRDASGQVVNFDKSSIVFSKSTSNHIIDRVRALLPMEVVNKHEKYLGLPAVVGKSKREVFANIRDKIRSRLQGWKEKWLSKGGKEILIKAVVQAIPTYAMSCFKLPGYLTMELENYMAKFWWENKHGKGIHWTKWQELCDSKQSGGIGFRVLDEFNTALLAKQIWRLLENPESLLGQLLKARYYPNTSVLDASLGSNPSYTWRSLCSSIYLVKAGLRWRIGNGRSVNIWKDKWLPRESTFQIFTPIGDREPEMKVNELIDEDTGLWKSDLIQEIFFEDDCKAILAIPLGKLVHSYRYIWHYNRNGLFSVRSAYHLAVRIRKNGGGQPGNSSNSHNAQDWKWIWALTLPSKIKIFLWRACKNLLPTCTNLMKRKVLEVNRCAFCDEMGEDVMHIFAYCTFARQVWALSGIPLSTYHTSEIELGAWLRTVKKKLDSKAFEQCILLCWAIWYTRNKRVFEGTIPDAMNIVEFSKKYWNELHTATSQVLDSCLLRNRPLVRWIPPEPNVVKINFDASVNNKDGICCFGAIGRSNLGVCVGWVSRFLKSTLDPASAEAKAALLAVEMARQNNWAAIILEGDSQEIIATIQGRSSSRAEYGNIIEDIKQMSETFAAFTVQHIFREGNRVAHEVASLSKKGPCN